MLGDQLLVAKLLVKRVLVDQNLVDQLWLVLSYLTLGRPVSCKSNQSPSSRLASSWSTCS